MMAYRRRVNFGFSIPGVDLPSGVDPSNPSSLIDSIEFESNYTPTGLSISPNGDSGTSGSALPYLKALQPKFIVHFKAGIPNYVLAPYGEPGPSKWDTIQTVGELAAMGLVGLLAFSVVSILQKKK